MYDLLTKEEDAQANARHWVVQHVYDLKLSRWIVQILPLPKHRLFADAHALARAVIEDARSGDKLALRALQLVMRGYQNQGKK